MNPHGSPPAPRRATARAAAWGTWLCSGLALAAPVQLTVTDGSGRPVADAIVFLESPAARAAVRPLKTYEIEQVNREFRPAVSVIPTGTPVEFPNRDSIRHHVYSFSEVKKFEIRLYTGRPASPVVFDKPGIAVLGCNIHDAMAAWVVVVDTPHYGRTDGRGQLTLDVPKGDYRLRAWHMGLPAEAPPADQPLTVTDAGGRAAVQLRNITL